MSFKLSDQFDVMGEENAHKHPNVDVPEGSTGQTVEYFGKIQTFSRNLTDNYPSASCILWNHPLCNKRGKYVRVLYIYHVTLVDVQENRTEGQCVSVLCVC